MSEFNVIVSNHFVFDRVAFQYWLLGLGVEPTLNLILQKLESVQDLSLQLADNKQLPSRKTLASYLLMQFRNFEILEAYLQRPRYLSRQLIFPLDNESKDFMVESFYSFDSGVLREIIGKKFNSRGRKDLDQVAAKTKVPLGACRRMFDNFKRVTKKVEDSEGNIVKIIQNEFCLKIEQARQYAHFIFIISHRLDTQRKKLFFMDLSDFEYLTSLFFICLTTAPYNTAQSSAVDEFDPAIVHDTAQIRSFLTSSRDLMEHLRIGVVRYMKSRLRVSEELGGTKNAPHRVSKSNSSKLPNIASNLSLSAFGHPHFPPPFASGSTNVPQMLQAQQSEATSGVVPSPLAAPSGEYAHGNTGGVDALTSPLFRSLLRNIFNICLSIRNSKKVRLIFLHILEKTVEFVLAPPLRWDENMVSLFFRGLQSCWVRLFGGVVDGKPTAINFEGHSHSSSSGPSSWTVAANSGHSADTKSAKQSGASDDTSPGVIFENVPGREQKQMLDQSMWRVCVAMQRASLRIISAAQRSIAAPKITPKPTILTAPATLDARFLGSNSVKSNKSAPPTLPGSSLE